MQFKQVITQAMDAPLPYAMAIQVFENIMTGIFTPVQTAALLSVLAVRGEYIDEYTAAVHVMRRHSVKVQAPVGAMDIVGTGGDSKSTLNISTATAFVVAGAGICVAKHGNKAVSSASGAADVLTASDINVMIPPHRAQNILSDVGLMFLMAPVYHPAMKVVAPVRAEIGMRTIFNVLGPMTNPAGVAYQLTGAFSQDLLMPMAQILQKSGTKSTWLVHGIDDGTDEISITGETRVVKLENNRITKTTIHPDTVGLPVHTLDEITGGTPTHNAQAMLSLLEGQHSAYRNAVLFNAAAALVICEAAQDLKTGIEMSRESIDSRKALHKFNALKKACTLST